MIENDKILSLKELSRHLINSAIIEPFIIKGNKVNFDYNQALHNEIHTLLENINFSCEYYSDGKVEFQLPENYYLDNNDFQRRYKDQSEEDFNKSEIIILKSSNKLAIKEVNQTFTQDNAIIHNYKVYKSLIEYLKNSKEKFSEHFNEATKEFLIVSQSNKKGVLKIGYKQFEERLKDEPDLSILFNRMVEDFNSKEFPVFFKDRVFQSIGTKYEINDRLFQIIKSLISILDDTEKDYRIFLQDFNLENIKSRFKEQRLKFFESLDKNLETINKQISSVPLSFSATIFAAYQVKDRYYILILIFIGLLLYTMLSWKSISLAAQNIKYIKDDINEELKIIERDYGELKEEYKSDFNKIKSKINSIESLIFLMRLILISLLVMFIIYSLFQIINFPFFQFIVLIFTLIK